MKECGSMYQNAKARRKIRATLFFLRTTCAIVVPNFSPASCGSGELSPSLRALPAVDGNIEFR